MIFGDFRCIHRGGGGFREKKCQETRMNMKPLIVSDYLLAWRRLSDVYYYIVFY
jgi:hypothetical protein